MPTFDQFIADRPELQDASAADQLFYYQEFCDEYHGINFDSMD